MYMIGFGRCLINWRRGMKARYDSEVRKVVFRLHMLYQKDTRKLEPRWRGPFQINGYEGSHGSFFTLVQLNGRGIRGALHGDHLRRLISRTGYLIEPSPIPYRKSQPIRKRRARQALKPNSQNLHLSDRISCVP